MRTVTLFLQLNILLLSLSFVLLATDGKEIEIVSHGGVVSWVDKENLTYEINPVTGTPEINSRGNPIVQYHTYASFTGSSTFQFPNDTNITFLAEINENTSLPYWIVDGEIKMGEQGGLGSSGISILTLPHPSITVDSNISKIEAVFVSKPSETSALPSPISLTDSTSREIEIISHGGIVSWVDKNSVRMERDPTTGVPILNSRGEIAVEFHTYASFTGSSTFQFPNDSNITLLAELDDNNTLAYWIVDGEIKMGEQGGNVQGLISLTQPHITIDFLPRSELIPWPQYRRSNEMRPSNISQIEAVFIPKPKFASPHIQRNEKIDDHLIISNGGVIQWISPQPNPVVERDPRTGTPVLDKYGSPKYLRTILGYFTGTQNYTFPPSFLLTFYPEPLLNHEFGYWLIDGEMRLGSTSDISNYETTPDFPDNSITIGNRFKVIEAVYFPIPLNSSRYIDESKLIYSEEDISKRISDAVYQSILLDRKDWVGGYQEGLRAARETSNESDYVLGVQNGEDNVKLDPTSYNLISKAYHEEILQDLNTRLKNISSNNSTHYTEGWFYLPNRGWMWTNHSSYPYFYDAEDKDWMYFQSGEEKPRFYRYKTKTWLTIE